MTKASAVPDKRYLALVRGLAGDDDEGLIDHPLARDPELPSTGQPMLGCPDPLALPHTHQLVATGRPGTHTTRVALLDLWPTGPAAPDPAPPRTSTHPIIGDATHGKGRSTACSLPTSACSACGCAAELALPHPVTHEPLRITAEPGPEWRRLISVP